MSTDDVGGTTANDPGGADDMLSPMEATDSDLGAAKDGEPLLRAVGGVKREANR